MGAVWELNVITVSKSPPWHAAQRVRSLMSNGGSLPERVRCSDAKPKLFPPKGNYAGASLPSTMNPAEAPRLKISCRLSSYCRISVDL